MEINPIYIAICNLEIRKTYLGKSTNLLNMYSIRGVRERVKLQLMSIHKG